MPAGRPTDYSGYIDVSSAKPVLSGFDLSTHGDYQVECRALVWYDGRIVAVEVGPNYQRLLTREEFYGRS